MMNDSKILSLISSLSSSSRRFAIRNNNKIDLSMINNTVGTENDRAYKGLVIVLSAPSGGGKSSLAKALLASNSNLVVSVSATTRNPRPGDMEGLHYLFKTREEFLRMVNDNEFLEYSEIYSNLYGIPKYFVYEQINQGKDILFAIDPQGAYKLKKILKDIVMVSIFILPPSIEVLRSRLRNRAQDSNEEIDVRIALAQGEIAQAKNYDHIVINEDFAATLQSLQEIIRIERGKRGDKGHASLG